MSSDKDTNTGATELRSWPRSRRVPLDGIVPLRRNDFTQTAYFSGGGVFDSNIQEVNFQNSILPNPPKPAGEKIQPVYAAAFSAKKQPRQDAATTRVARKGDELTEDFPLPRYEAPDERKLVVKPKNWFKLTSRFAAAAMAILFFMSGFFMWHSYSSSAGLAEAAPSTAILAATHATPENFSQEGDAQINILLLGIGGEGHAGADLSDTIVLASIDPVNKTATLLSIPRDLWVEMPNHYFGTHQKINAVYSAGKYDYYAKHGKTNEKAAVQAGLTALDGVIEQVVGVPVQYNALVNFTAFKQAVDAVGGVNITVKTALVDPTMAWENNGDPVLAKTGTQTMDGATALRYVRSRHTSSDFARSMRQRDVLVALRDKVLTTGTLANPIKIQQLIAAFGKNVSTDISTADIIRLYGIANTIDESAITSLDLVSGDHAFVTTDSVGSTSVVRPKLGFDRYSDIQSYVRANLRDGYLVKENASVVVVARTQDTADQKKTMLSNLGYNTLPSVIAPNINSTKTTVVDLSGGLAPYTRHYLEKRFGSNFTDTLPKGLVVPDNAQFVILVSE